MTGKEFVGADLLINDSFLLARQVHDSGFKPDVLLVLWRGGATVGTVVHEFFLYKGTRIRDLVVKVESYSSVDRRREPRIENRDVLVSSVTDGARVLVVDDIYDSGETIRVIRDALGAKTSDVRLAALYWRIRPGQESIGPDYFVRKVDRWIVFPHEIVDLSLEEIRQKGDSISRLVG